MKDDEPKTRREKKGRDDKGARNIYSQKAVRAKEALMENRPVKKDNKGNGSHHKH